MKNFKAKKFLAAMALGGVAIFGVTAPAQATIEVSAVVKVDKEVVNWDKGAESDVVAIGIVSPPDPRGLSLTREAAIMSAQRTLAGIVNGLQIDSDTTMQDFRVNDTVNRKIGGVLTGAQIIEEDMLSDGGYYVKMRVPFYGRNSIAAAIIPELAQGEPKPFEKVTETELPPSEVQTLQTTTYTGVVIDASGLYLDETFSPVVYDTNGRAIYGVKNLQPSKVISMGMVSYSESAQDQITQDRAGSSPLIVKAVEVRGGKNSVNMVNVVISVEDADRILLANENSHMLESCSVVFIK